MTSSPRAACRRSCPSWLDENGRDSTLNGPFGSDFGPSATMQTFCGLVLFATAVAEKPRPQVPQRFSAHLWLDQHDLTGVSTGQGLYAQDGRQRVMRVEANFPKSTSTLLLTNMPPDPAKRTLTGMKCPTQDLCRGGQPVL